MSLRILNEHLKDIPTYASSRIPQKRRKYNVFKIKRSIICLRLLSGVFYANMQMTRVNAGCLMDTRALMV